MMLMTSEHAWDKTQHNTIGSAVQGKKIRTIKRNEQSIRHCPQCPQCLGHAANGNGNVNGVWQYATEPSRAEPSRAERRVDRADTVNATAHYTKR